MIGSPYNCHTPTPAVGVCIFGLDAKTTPAIVSSAVQTRVLERRSKHGILIVV